MLPFTRIFHGSSCNVITIGPKFQTNPFVSIFSFSSESVDNLLSIVDSCISSDDFIQTAVNDAPPTSRVPRSVLHVVIIDFKKKTYGIKPPCKGIMYI